jgi:hypothetical protein
MNYKILNGKDFNYFKKPIITSTTFKPNNEEPDILFNIKYLVSFSMVNEGNAKVEYSFNGTTVHGDMIPGTATSTITFDNRRVSAIWFRVPDGGSVTVRVEAWSAG